MEQWRMCPQREDQQYAHQYQGPFLPRLSCPDSVKSEHQTGNANEQIHFPQKTAAPIRRFL
jgi:hypothetical protein